MAATPSIKLTFPLWYRGGTREYSNRYHFSGGTPATDAAWDTLRDNILNAFKLVVPAGVNAMKVDCYVPGSEVAVRTTNPTFAGTMALSGQAPMPQDTAALLRFTTTQRTTKNHPVYLFQWLKPCYGSTTGDGQQLLAAYKTLITTYGNAWISGFSDGSVTHVKAGPNGAVAQSLFVDPYIRHHDFRP